MTRLEKVTERLNHMLNIPVSKDYDYVHTIEYYALKLSQELLDSNNPIKMDEIVLKMKDHILHGDIHQ